MGEESRRISKLSKGQTSQFGLLEEEKSSKASGGGKRIVIVVQEKSRMPKKIRDLKRLEKCPKEKKKTGASDRPTSAKQVTEKQRGGDRRKSGRPGGGGRVGKELRGIWCKVGRQGE